MELQPIKIGLLLRDINALQTWEWAILEHIMNDNSLQLSLVVNDGRIGSSRSSTPKRSVNQKLSYSLFKRQGKIESPRYPSDLIVDQETVRDFVMQTESISISPRKKGYHDIFNEAESKLVADYGLDVLLRHGFRIIQGPILEAAKYGIWSYHHGDNDTNRGLLPGFWEILQKEPVIGATLQILTSELDGGLIIDKGHYPTRKSHFLNRVHICDQSVSLFTKNIRLLQHGQLTREKSTTYSNPLYSRPKLGPMLRYLRQYYSYRWSKRISKWFGPNTNSWTLFFGNGEFLESSLFRLRPQQVPKKQFWADPFLYKHKGDTYVFFEDFSYAERRGKISCGILREDKVTDIKTALDLGCHTSYPQVFEEDGEIYMLPEVHKKKRLEIYKCVSFPDHWELYSHGFEGELIVDATYYRDDDGNRWLFMNKSTTGGQNNDLFVYQIGSLKLEEIMGHLRNPVLTDCRFARNAGSIFKYDGKVMRPSQNFSFGIYGYGLNVRIIEKLNLENYLEKDYVCVYPKFNKGLKATHHLHQIDGCFAIDGSYSHNWF